MQPVFFKLFEGEEEIIDQYGYKTGSYVPKYGELKSTLLCVSPNKGTSEQQQFGSLTDYDRTATTSDTKCEINENAVLWVDGADTNQPYNYIVKQVAPWKNSIAFAIKEVTVSQYKKQQEEIAKASEVNVNA
jgi:hypothetical protein